MHCGLKHFQSKSHSDPHFYNALHYIADISESLQAKFFLNEMQQEDTSSDGIYCNWYEPWGRIGLVQDKPHRSMFG